MGEDEQGSRLVQMTLEAFIPIPCFLLAAVTNFSPLVGIIGISYTACAIYHFRNNVYRKSHWLSRGERIFYGVAELIVAGICFVIAIIPLVG